MNSDRSHLETKESWVSLLPGALLAVVGGACVLMVLAGDIGGTPKLEALAWRLGLAVGPLIMAFGQVTGLVGLWLMWRARRPRK
jgi:Mg/Co/Ni transporter MgtE